MFNLQADVSDEQILDLLTEMLVYMPETKITKVDCVMQIDESDQSLVFAIDIYTEDGQHWESFLQHYGEWGGSHIARDIQSVSS